MAIRKEKLEALKQKMEALGIFEDDIVEKFVIGSGKGGQKLQKTSSAVHLKHAPTGITIKCQQERSRELNRYYARQELMLRVEETLLKEKSERQKAVEKIRRQKRKRSKRAKEKMLEGKKRLSEKKKLRQKITNNEK